MAVETPAWVRELDISLITHPQILLVGNVRDEFLLPAEHDPREAQPMRLADVVERACRRRGYGVLSMFDLVHDRMELWNLGATPPDLPDSLRAMAAADAMSGGPQNGGGAEPDAAIHRRTRQVLRDVVEHRGAPIGIMFPYANRLGSPRSELTGEGKLLMAAAEALGHEALPVAGPQPVMPYNTVFWVAERQEQLPVEFAMTPRTVRVITIPQAPMEQRRAAAVHVVGTVLRAHGKADAPEAVSYADNLLSATHGMTNTEVLKVASIALDQDIPVHRLDEAARLYKLGVQDNPWSAPDVKEKIRQGEAVLTGQARDDNDNLGVVGQDRAVRKAIDIFMRSAAGMTGAQSSSSPNRPRGVLFLSGPTGVGKTELAKGIARMIFGKDAAPIRFDMSEFAQEHARERLIGAPPGYVGFEAGGELTNRVRAEPMSVLLFDEIDKAHERLFDLFLQILEDGRLTDGRGSTVYFTESVLIFTSNLGMTQRGPGGSVKQQFSHRDKPEDVRRVLEDSFVDFFDNKIGRPELRNRLGDAFIAMDFIQPDAVPELLDKALRSVRRRASIVHQITLDVSADAVAVLRENAIEGLDHGGRGVNNTVERLLINPLARHMLMQPPVPGEVWTVDQVVEEAVELKVSRCSG